LYLYYESYVPRKFFNTLFFWLHHHPQLPPPPPPFSSLTYLLTIVVIVASAIGTCEPTNKEKDKANQEGKPPHLSLLPTKIQRLATKLVLWTRTKKTMKKRAMAMTTTPPQEKEGGLCSCKPLLVCFFITLKNFKIKEF
jgi:hypothetical protein